MKNPQNMNPSFFVTGTGTDVGKTFFASLFMAKYAISHQFQYWKPIQTGTRDSRDRVSVQNQTKLPDESFIPSLYEFNHPSSPVYASALESIQISEKKLISEIKQNRSKRLLIEGAGGIAVPITSELLTWQMVQATNLNVVVVVSSELGTINHSLLTLESLAYHSIPIFGFYMVGKENELRISNANEIEKWGPAPFLGFTPFPETPLNPSQFSDFAKSQFDSKSALIEILMEGGWDEG